jgi:hypothetical protein
MIRHIVCWKFLDHAEGVSKAEKTVVDYELPGP